jgi:protein-disulfide isomerase
VDVAPQLQSPVHDRDHRAGPADAPVTLVEYGDYQCPDCAAAHLVVESIQAELGPKLRFVYRNFPLTQIHGDAAHAAEAAESVAADGGDTSYWKMHNMLFAKQGDGDTAFDDTHLGRYAMWSGVPAAVVIYDLHAGRYAGMVRTEAEGGVRSGVTGTPTFFINGQRFTGDWSQRDAFRDALDPSRR